MDQFTKEVAQFSKATGSPILKVPKIPANGRENLRYDLLEEELSELLEAIETRNLTEALDAMVDLQYVLSGAVLEFGFGDIFEKAFAEVHRSNMSKFCTTTEDARESVNQYIDKGIEAYYKKEGNVYVIYRSSDNKVLKGMHFSKPGLAAIIREDKKEKRNQK